MPERDRPKDRYHTCPPELLYLWEWYLDLQSSRIFTNVANALTYQEIEAFERKQLVHLSAWECRVLRDVDRATVAALNERAHPKIEAEKPKSIDVNDTEAIEAMFGELAKKGG